MALQDILQAITTEADSQIAEAQAAHKKRMKDMKEEHEKTLHTTLTEIRQRKEARKRQMRSRAEAQARMLSSNALLRRKREHLDAFYDGIADELSKMPAPKQEAFLSAWMTMKGKGVVHPAQPHAALVKKLAGEHCKVGEPIQAKGGFRFVGEAEDRDCTYEFIIEKALRPETEIEVAQRLFPSPKR
jgi:vacuolar-type H+-ATPase subunit E/Vma4